MRTCHFFKKKNKYAEMYRQLVVEIEQNKKRLLSQKARLMLST